MPQKQYIQRGGTVVKRSLWLYVIAFAFAGIASAADVPLPKTDAAGAKDSGLLGRFSGSLILTYDTKDFDELALPASPLKPIDARDDRNNRVHKPDKALALEGRRTRIVYLLPEGVAPLQAIRNYQNEVKAKGGKTLFECKDIECGGAQKLSGGGGGSQSMSMHLWPVSKITDKHGSLAYCAQAEGLTEQRFTALEFPGSSAHAAVLAYAFKDQGACKAMTGRTVVALTVVERADMAQKMTTVRAEEMGQSIASTGRIALYGVYFDSNKADVKAESKATLEEIARLLKSNPSLKVLVVGHTDNVGGLAANMELSKRRAEAVVSTLVSQYNADPKRMTPMGVSFASPIASNADEKGRAQNRRVELVANN
jgi:OmpA-OmpF porin, OOP family